MCMHVFSNMFKSISDAYAEGSPLYPPGGGGTTPAGLHALLTK